MIIRTPRYEINCFFVNSLFVISHLNSILPITLTGETGQVIDVEVRKTASAGALDRRAGLPRAPDSSISRHRNAA